MVIIFLCIIGIIIVWYFHRNNSQIKPVESIYVEPDEPIIDDGREPIASVYENVGPFNRNSRVYVNQTDINAQTYEPIYVSEEEVELNIWQKRLIGKNYSDRSNCSNSDHPNRAHHPSSPKIYQNI